MDAPVKGELEGSPVEASASRQLLRVAGGAALSAHRTCILELMATLFLPCASVGGAGGCRGSAMRRAASSWADRSVKLLGLGRRAPVTEAV